MKEEPHFYLATLTSKPGFKWAIGFDKDLASLPDEEGIHDPDEQMRVCTLLCALGLAEHRMFGEEDIETCQHQEHYYAATKKMRKLL